MALVMLLICSGVGGRLLSGLRIALDVLTVRFVVLLPAALVVVFFAVVVFRAVVLALPTRAFFCNWFCFFVCHDSFSPCFRLCGCFFGDWGSGNGE
jgi:hypothetical protein